jgi:hypothetical protein
MSPNEATNQIRKLIAELPSKKTGRERLRQIILVKAYVEQLQETFSQQAKSEEVKQDAAGAKKKVIKKALRQLLSAFDKIYAKHEELGDSDVRDRVSDAIQNAFIKPAPKYKLPFNFGMFSEEANKMVQTAVQRFLEHPQVVAGRKSLKTAEERLKAFQDFDVETSEGTNVFEYFGYKTKPG